MLPAGELLKAWRSRNGVSQRDFGQRLKPSLSQPAIHQLEHGLYMPQVDQAVQIEAITDGFVPVGAWKRKAS